MSLKILSYSQASLWAQKNNIKTKAQWYNAKNTLPPNIPPDPALAYKKKWIGWSNFLKSRSSGHRPTATYEECKTWAKKNCIQTAKQWYSLKERLPFNMPTAPDRAFKGRWTTWEDFLGTNKLSGTSIAERVMRLVLDSIFSPKAKVHRKQTTQGSSGKNLQVDMLYPNLKLAIEYDGEFYHLNKEDLDENKTKDLQNCGWKVIRIREGKLDVIDPLWDVRIRKSHKKEEGVKIVLRHILDLNHKSLITLNQNNKEGLEGLLENLDLFKFYHKIGKHSEFLTYKKCQKWAIKHKISSETQWREFRHKMEKDGVPRNPDVVYKDKGWVNWPTFLENGQRSKRENWATYEEVMAWARNSGVKSAREWYRLGSKRPNNMPQSLESVYKEQWKNWPEFLNNGKRSWGSCASYQEASSWAKINNIKTGGQWRSFQNKPKNMPSYPDNVYIEEWAGWAAFLGVEPYQGKVPTKKLVRKRVTERKFNFVSYEECAIWAKNNGVKTCKDWKKIKNRPSNIPSDPPKAYKKIWVSWPEFFKI